MLPPYGLVWRRCHGVQAYDQHLNMILGEVEETITTVEIDDETYEEIIKVRGMGWGGVGTGAVAGATRFVCVAVVPVFRA